ncbi:MAG: hypothetical protein WCG28_02385 [bacterium]
MSMENVLQNDLEDRFYGIDPGELGSEYCQMIEHDEATVKYEKDEKGKITSVIVIKNADNSVLYFKDIDAIFNLEQKKL